MTPRTRIENPEILDQLTPDELGTMILEFLDEKDVPDADIQLLIDCGANLYIRGLFGFTSLLKAAWGNKFSAVRMLLASGVNINTQSDEGYTPLHIAAYRNSMESFNALLEFGADPDIKSRNGATPWDIAIEFGNHDICEIIAALDRAKV